MFDVETGKDSQLTSVLRQEVSMFVSEAPTGWSADGRSVITVSGRYKPGHMAIAILPRSASPEAETRG